jgi:hypothetical protein
MGHRIVSTTVDIYLDDVGDGDLIEELEDRGYTVQKEAKSLLDVITWYKRGDVKEALIQLEKVEPELFGISEKVK